MEIKDLDLKKSEQMFKDREEFEKFHKEYEKRQQAFIDEMIEKYNIQTKEDLMEIIHLFPESSSKFFVLCRFNKKSKIDSKVESDI